MIIIIWCTTIKSGPHKCTQILLISHHLCLDSSTNCHAFVRFSSDAPVYQANSLNTSPDSRFYGANMGLMWGRQEPWPKFFFSDDGLAFPWTGTTLQIFFLGRLNLCWAESFINIIRKACLKLSKFLPNSQTLRNYEIILAAAGCCLVFVCLFCSITGVKQGSEHHTCSMVQVNPKSLYSGYCASDANSVRGVKQMLIGWRVNIWYFKYSLENRPHHSITYSITKYFKSHISKDHLPTWDGENFLGKRTITN